MPYASERLRESRYAYSEDEVKQYFTEPRVLAGLYEVIETLFNVRLVETPVSSWHADVRGVRVESPEGALIGHLYLDLYARAGKQSGAWVDSERTRRLAGGRLQTPVAYLTCNFSRPNGERAAVLTHDDVITLFHETGHALHALLSEVDEPGAAAFSSVEWDAIELPSQFMENFCWEWAVVQKLSAHADTGETLPRALYDRMIAARNYQSGMQTVRQIEFALFDMLMHDRAQGISIAQVLALLQEVRQEVAVLFPPAWHRLPHAFSHLFAGGYGAGYYTTSGPRCCRPTPTRPSRKPPPASRPARRWARWTRRPARASAAKCWPWAVRVRRRNPSPPSVAARRVLTRCCATAA